MTSEQIFKSKQKIFGLKVRMVMVSLVTRLDQTRLRVAKVLFWNWEMHFFFSLIGTNICLKLQNVFVFYCNTNIFVQNGGRYSFQITKCTCLKLQNLSKSQRVFGVYANWYMISVISALLDCFSVLSMQNLWLQVEILRVASTGAYPRPQDGDFFICVGLGLVRKAPLYRWPRWKGTGEI